MGYSEELEQVKQNHKRELEEASKGRVLAVDELQKSHDTTLANLKSEIAQLKSDLDDQREETQRAVSETATLKARSPPATPTPKAQTNGVISKDELAKLHQAHDAKVAELETEMEKRVQALTEEKDALRKAQDDLQSSLERKEMEREMYESAANEAEAEIKGCGHCSR